MIVGLLVLIVAILLFGAATVKGWIKGAVALVGGAIILLFAVGLIASRYNGWQRDREHRGLVDQAKPMIVRDVAQKAKVAEGSLIDIVTYDQDTEVYLCGSIAGTSGYGGSSGRRRFLSNGGNTELEQPSAQEQFNGRIALHCTADPASATMR